MVLAAVINARHTHNLRSYAYVLSIDVGFSVEGRTKNELPELIWGAFRLTKPDLERSRTLQDAYPDAYVEAMRYVHLRFDWEVL